MKTTFLILVALQLIVQVLFAQNNDSKKSIESLVSTLIGTSSNIYSVIIPSANWLDADPFSHTILFTHRQGGLWGGNSNNLYCKFSNNFGVTWDSIAFINNGSNLLRYPNGVLYNPSGNTNLDSCYAIVCGSSTNGANYISNYFGSVKLDGSFMNMQYIPVSMDSSIKAYTNLVSCNGKFHVLASVMSYPTSDLYYYKIYNGQFNNSTHSVNWSESNIHNSWKYSGNPNIAFSNNGMHGYFFSIGIDSLDDPYQTFIPITWETFDGGVTWSKNIFHYFDLIPTFRNKIWPIRTTLYLPDNLKIFRPNFTNGVTNEEYNSPAVVDASGNLHIAVLVEGMYSNNPDSLDYEYAQQPFFLFDVIKTNNGWGAVFIDTIQTYDVGADQSGFGTGTDATGWDHMIHISKSSDEKKIFFTWTDTYSTIDSININPQIKACGYDIISQQMTSVTSFNTSNGNIYFMQVPDKIIDTGSTYIIPVSYVDINESGLHPLQSQKHYLLYGVQFADSNFVIPVDPGYTVNISHNEKQQKILFEIFPNPIIDETSISYKLDEPSKISLDIYDILGNKKEIILNKLQETGTYNYKFSFKQMNCNAGLYLLKLTINEKSLIKKIIFEGN